MNRLRLILRLCGLVLLTGLLVGGSVIFLWGSMGGSGDAGLGQRIFSGVLGLFGLVGSALIIVFLVAPLIEDSLTPLVTLRTQVVAERMDTYVGDSEYGQVSHYSYYLTFEAIGEFEVSHQEYLAVKKGDAVIVTYGRHSRTVTSIQVVCKRCGKPSYLMIGGLCKDCCGWQKATR